MNSINLIFFFFFFKIIIVFWNWFSVVWNLDFWVLTYFLNNDLFSDLISWLDCIRGQIHAFLYQSRCTIYIEQISDVKKNALSFTDIDNSLEKDAWRIWNRDFEIILYDIKNCHSSAIFYHQTLYSYLRISTAA